MHTRLTVQAMPDTLLQTAVSIYNMHNQGKQNAMLQKIPLPVKLYAVLLLKAMTII